MELSNPRKRAPSGRELRPTMAGAARPPACLVGPRANHPPPDSVAGESRERGGEGIRWIGEEPEWTDQQTNE